MIISTINDTCRGIQFYGRRIPVSVESKRVKQRVGVVWGLGAVIIYRCVGTSDQPGAPDFAKALPKATNGKQF